MATIAQLVVAKDIEAQRTFEGISSPYDLALYMARILGVDISQFTNLSELIVSPLEPTGLDRTKLWVKTEGAPAIGLPIGGSYQLIYQYPPYIPLLWTRGSSDLPFYFRRLTEGEMDDYSLTAPTSSDYFYVILEV